MTIKDYQGSLVYVAQDNADGTSDVAVLQQVATADLTDVATDVPPAPVEPPAPDERAAIQAQIDALNAEDTTDEAQVAANQEAIAALQAQLDALGQTQPPSAPGA
jgi:hypothetical protein